jgi:diguanylate cyclase (GGDEF)-like protein
MLIAPKGAIRMHPELRKLTPPAVLACQGVLGGGFALLAAHNLLGLGAGMGWLDDWLSDSLMTLAAVLCLTRAALWRQERMAWLLIGLSLAAWAAGDIYWTLDLAELKSPPFPSLADIGYLGFYPLIITGLALLLRERIRVVRPAMWLDALVVALGVTAISIEVLIVLVVRNAGASGLDLVATLAYPVGDTLLLAFSAALLALTGVPGRAWGLIVAGLGVTAFADAAYSYTTYGGTYTAGGWIDLLWPLGAGLVAVSAWQGRPKMAARMPRGWRVMAVPAAAALLVAMRLGVYPLVPVEPAALVVMALMLCAIVARIFLTTAENQKLLNRVETDPLTGLGNRGKLLEDLSEAIGAGHPHVLGLFDLDGFKQYNDSFGHPAGDAMLGRLGRRLAESLPEGAGAYRIGGDEFCILVPDASAHALSVPERSAAALAERGDEFAVTASFGTVDVPEEAATPATALQIADKRMYAYKDARRESAGGQAKAVLLRALSESQPDLSEHLRSVSELAMEVGAGLRLERGELIVLSRAAELHDLGKVAIPDAILDKPGPLNEAEWEFMKQHTILGERILSSAPALAHLAPFVRASHEHFDGSGYPDGLAEDEIPLISRIILACDAFAAMTSERPYAAAHSEESAIAEMRRCAGTQFDPRIVEALCDVLREPRRPAAAVLAQVG